MTRLTCWIPTNILNQMLIICDKENISIAQLLSKKVTSHSPITAFTPKIEG